MSSSYFTTLIVILGAILAIIFIFLGLLHFYWAIGGKSGFSDTLPTTSEGKPVINPKSIDSVIVGATLVCFGLFYLNVIGWLKIILPRWITSYLGWAIAVVFTLRVIGEFKYIGLTKKIKHTPFAKKDANIYVPLCFFIALLAIIIELGK